MSGDQLAATSFGDPNAQPPTPRQTPTCVAFPSPDFETPQLFQKTPFEDGGTSRHSSSSWTSGPGNDISPFSSTAPVHAAESHRHFTAYTPVSTAGRTLSTSSSASSAGSNPSTTPTAHAHSHPAGVIARPPARRRIPSILLNRPLSAGDIAARIASHATHFSPNPNLPTVDPSFRLSSSPLPLSSISREWSPEANDNDADDKSFQERARKRLRTGSATGTNGPNSAPQHPSKQAHHPRPTQIATPPPSASKGDRKPPSGPTATTMQDDQGFGHPDFLGATTTPHQQHSGDLTAAFAASGHDVFGYPLSAGAAPASYWDPSVSMTAMDLDFAQAAASGILFQPPAQTHRGIDSFDWNSNPALFQDPTVTAMANNVAANGVPQSVNQESVQPPAKKGRPLAPKPSRPSDEIPVSGDLAGPYLAGSDAAFTLSPSGGVDPGLLFSRPPSSGMDVGFNQAGHAEAAPRLAEPAPVAPSSADPLRRSFSYKEPTRRGRREPASSPIKNTHPRNGLQRSFSESRGKRQLPPLAPAATRQASQGGGSGAASGRPSSSGRSGRISPLKLHHRLTSLSSIPESNGPRTRTSVKFTIDARGRAHAETTTVAEEPSPMRRASRDSGSSGGRRAPAVLGSSGSDDSDTDDEPIIIPSRNSSFALPDPRKPVGSIFSSGASGRKKKNPQVRASFSFNGRGLSPGDESEAETVVDSRSDREGSAGDAASELRKMVEDRQNKRVASQRAQRMGSSSANGTFEWGGASVVSPTHITDAIPTPLTGGRRLNIRCICHRNDQGSAADTFMVQCEACEMWLHGRCTKITRREMPPVYICAFCANTPNMRGGRLRDTGRAGSSNVAMGSGMPSSSHGHGHGHGTSPLAHKSFKSFR